MRNAIVGATNFIVEVLGETAKRLFLLLALGMLFLVSILVTIALFLTKTF